MSVKGGRRRVRRERLHRLVDDLPDESVPAAERELERLSEDQLGRALAQAPLDDETITADEEAQVAQARADARRGLSRPWREAFRELEDETA